MRLIKAMPFIDVLNLDDSLKKPDVGEDGINNNSRQLNIPGLNVRENKF